MARVPLSKCYADSTRSKLHKFLAVTKGLCESIMVLLAPTGGSTFEGFPAALKNRSSIYYRAF
ncbi:MAG: hypothetical protein V1792_08210 [Pseudomonadota bacterium]